MSKTKTTLKFTSKNVNLMIRKHLIEDKPAILDFYADNHPEAYSQLFNYSKSDLRNACSRVFNHSLKYSLGNTAVDTNKDIITFGFMATDFYHNLRDNFKKDYFLRPNAPKLEVEFIQQLNSKIPAKFMPTKFGEVCGVDACVNPMYSRLGILKNSFIYFIREAKERKYKYLITRNIAQGSKTFISNTGAIKVGYINLTDFTTSEGIRPFKNAEKLFVGQHFDNEINALVLDIQTADLDYLEKNL